MEKVNKQFSDLKNVLPEGVCHLWSCNTLPSNPHSDCPQAGCHGGKGKGLLEECSDRREIYFLKGIFSIPDKAGLCLKKFFE